MPSLLSTPMCALAPKNHWLPLARLVHLGIALFLAVLGRRRSRDNRGIDDGARADADALARQVEIHRIEYLAA